MSESSTTFGGSIGVFFPFPEDAAACVFLDPGGRPLFGFTTISTSSSTSSAASSSSSSLMTVMFFLPLKGPLLDFETLFPVSLPLASIRSSSPDPASWEAGVLRLEPVPRVDRLDIGASLDAGVAMDLPADGFDRAELLALDFTVEKTKLVKSLSEDTPEVSSSSGTGRGFSVRGEVRAGAFEASLEEGALDVDRPSAAAEGFFGAKNGQS